VIPTEMRRRKARKGWFSKCGELEYAEDIMLGCT
jgi:hypothetical protein